MLRSEEREREQKLPPIIQIRKLANIETDKAKLQANWSKLQCWLPSRCSPILSQLLWPDRSSIKRALTSNVKSASWPRTVGRTDGRLGSVVSYDEDVRKLIHQTVQIRCSVHLTKARGGGVLTGALAMSSMSANMTDGCDCGRRRGRVRVQAVQS